MTNQLVKIIAVKCCNANVGTLAIFML